MKKLILIILTLNVMLNAEVIVKIHYSKYDLKQLNKQNFKGYTDRCYKGEVIRTYNHNTKRDYIYLSKKEFTTFGIKYNFRKISCGDNNKIIKKVEKYNLRIY